MRYAHAVPRHVNRTSPPPRPAGGQGPALAPAPVTAKSAAPAPGTGVCVYACVCCKRAGRTPCLWRCRCLCGVLVAWRVSAAPGVVHSYGCWWCATQRIQPLFPLCWWGTRRSGPAADVMGKEGGPHLHSAPVSNISVAQHGRTARQHGSHSTAACTRGIMSALFLLLFSLHFSSTGTTAPGPAPATATGGAAWGARDGDRDCACDYAFDASNASDGAGGKHGGWLQLLVGAHGRGWVLVRQLPSVTGLNSFKEFHHGRNPQNLTSLPPPPSPPCAPPRLTPCPSPGPGPGRPVAGVAQCTACPCAASRPGAPGVCVGGVYAPGPG